MPSTYNDISKIVLPNGDTCNLKDTTYSAATQSANGLMSSSDKQKLDGIEVATINETLTYLGISSS